MPSLSVDVPAAPAPAPAAVRPRRHPVLRAGGRRTGRPATLFAVLLALSFAVRAPSFRRPFWSPDEGYLATEAVALRHGGRMYADVVDRKPPLVPWLYEVCFDVAGSGSLWPVRVCAVVALAVTALFVARLAAAELGRWAELPAGVLTVVASGALPAPDAMAATFEVFMLPATAAAMYYGARRRFLAAGAAVAVAALTKQVGLAPLLPLAFQALGTRWRRDVAALAAGLLVPVLGCALLLGPRPFVFWVLLSSGSYAGSPPGAAALWAHSTGNLLRLCTVFAAFAPFAVYVVARRHGGGSRRFSRPAGPGGPGGPGRSGAPGGSAAPGGSGGPFRAWRVGRSGGSDGSRHLGRLDGSRRLGPFDGSRRSRPSRPSRRLGRSCGSRRFGRLDGSHRSRRFGRLDGPAGFRCFDRSLLLWLVASVAGVSVGFHFYGHYFLQLVPPMVLLALRVLSAAFDRPPGGPAGSGAALTRLGRGRTAAVAVGCAVTICAGFTAGALRAEPPLMGKSLAVAAAVDDLSAPGASVFLWGMHPEVYWLADRPAASRYLTAGLLTNFSGGGDVHRVGGAYAVPGAWPRFRRELAAAPPCLIVDDSAGTPYPLADYPSLARVVSRDYTLVAVVEGARVYRRAGCSP